MFAKKVGRGGDETKLLKIPSLKASEGHFYEKVVNAFGNLFSELQEGMGVEKWELNKCWAILVDVDTY